MKENGILSTIKIMNSQQELISEFSLADDWKITTETGHAVLHIPVIIKTFGELERLIGLGLEKKQIIIQIAKFKFSGFTVHGVVFSSIQNACLPDHVLTIKTISKENLSKEDILNWFQ